MTYVSQVVEQNVEDVVEHSVLVDDEQVVSVDVIIVTLHDEQEIDVVVEHSVDVEDEQVVDVEVTMVTLQEVQ